MAPEHRPDEAAIREQAYYLWEQDGRPDGHAMEYWQRAMVAVTEREQLSTLADDPPRRAKRRAADGKAAERAAMPAGKAKSKPKKT